MVEEHVECNIKLEELFGGSHVFFHRIYQLLHLIYEVKQYKVKKVSKAFDDI